MTPIKEVLKKMFATAKKSADQYNHTWLQKSAFNEESKSWDNLPTTVEQMKEDTSRDFIYNLWARTTDEGLADMDEFVEQELIPNGMSIFIDNETGLPTHHLSKDEKSIRFMVARPNLDPAS
tara:strand:+ start:1222 stop:1587 length:366 start_codon:yes stop_codon:yes gene_type:complete